MASSLIDIHINFLSRYRVLNSKVQFASTAKTVIARVACDQLLFAPTFIGIFFIYQGLMDGRNIRQIRNRLKSAYPTALAANYSIWPLVQFFNFRFVPLDYRSITVNTVALGWNSYMAYQNQQAKNAEENDN